MHKLRCIEVCNTALMRRFPGSKTNHPAGLLKMIVFVRKLKIKFQMFVSTNSDPFKIIFTHLYTF